MKFTPMNEEQIQMNSFELLKPGTYDFTVYSAEEKVSKTGNDYIFLKLQIWDEHGRERLIFTNLAFIKLLKHFCDVTGLTDKYELGEIFASDCLNKKGQCVIGFEKGKKKDNSDNEFYPDKNTVIDYVHKKANVPSQGKVDKSFDDDLPF